ncbi:hypothetical protein ILYODFUR_015953 [Ilyodon furcidens]|uniref:Secreted protein n=1 Tax=Ilyodon furcidens TaxID=33524 RepID=A0ABV0UGP9_9TELE
MRQGGVFFFCFVFFRPCLFSFSFLSHPVCVFFLHFTWAIPPSLSNFLQTSSRLPFHYLFYLISGISEPTWAPVSQSALTLGSEGGMLLLLLLLLLLLPCERLLLACNPAMGSGTRQKGT